VSKAAKRESDDTRLDRIEREIGEIRARVYNGLASEIRKEMDKSLDSIRGLIIGILISLLLALAGIIVESRFSNSAATAENMRNYKAIVDLQTQVEKIQDCIGE
jgi:tetrahydromethanopterin S-methyltransferase subunit G